MCSALGSRGSSVSLPTSVRGPCTEGGATKTPEAEGSAQEEEMRQRSGPVSRVTQAVWTQPAGPSTMGHGHLGFSGSLALGPPDPGWSGCWEGQRVLGSRGCRGTWRRSAHLSGPRSPFRSLLPGPQPRPAVQEQRSSEFLSLEAVGQASLCRRTGSRRDLQPLWLPLPGCASPRRHTHPDCSGRKGEICSI